MHQFAAVSPRQAECVARYCMQLLDQAEAWSARRDSPRAKCESAGQSQRTGLSAQELVMEWETPSFTEIDMSAEIGAYQGDFGPEPSEPPDCAPDQD